MKNSSQGSILSVVMVSTVLVAVVAASVISLVNTQRRVNLQRELQLQANATAETALDYVYSYVINDIERKTLAYTSYRPASGENYKVFDLSDKPDVRKFLLGNVVSTTGSDRTPGTITLEDLEVRILAPTLGKRYRVDGNDPANATDPNKDQWVNETLLPLVAKVTARQGSQKYTAYVQKGISTREIALFQYSIFFQGQLHLHRGFQPMGGVHANGNLFLNAHDGDTAIYNGAVTTASYFYRGSTFDQSGTGADAFGYVPVASDGKTDFTSTYGVSPRATGGAGQLKIYTQTIPGTPPTYKYENLATDLDSRKSSWKEDATRIFNGQLQDQAHLVRELAPVGSEGYRQDVKATADKNEFNNAPYSLIEPNLPYKSATDKHESHKDSLENSLQAKASLIFIVEYNDQITSASLRTTDGSAITSTHLPLPAGNANARLNYLIDPDADNVTATTSTTSVTNGSEPRIANPWKTFVVRAYKVSPTWDRSLGTDIHQLNSDGTPKYLIPVPLPSGVIGATTYHNGLAWQGTDITSITQDGVFEDFTIALDGASSNAYRLADAGATVAPLHISLIPAISSDTTNRGKINHADQRVNVTSGLFDSRLGRPVVPLTIDLAKLKYVMEAPIASLLPGTPDRAFRDAFDPNENIGTAAAPRKRWNGLVYVEFPTSLELQSATASGNDIPAGSAGPTGKSRRFAYGKKEKRHPDRWFDYDHESRKDRADSLSKGIVPIAPELRDYPDASHQTKTDGTKISSSNYGATSTILNERYAIPALQLINGRELPSPVTDVGFSIATNAPLYLVGNYNSDGDYTTGTSISDISPNAYSVKDTAIKEIPAAIFCDTFTILSNGWGETFPALGVNLSNRNRSFYGANNASTVSNTEPGRVGAPPGRAVRIRAAKTFTYGLTPVIHPATNRYVEISACIATGEYPIFEFFTHALENWAGTGAPTPIIIKGSMVGMYHAEIQHIKQAYGRTNTRDIQYYWQQHGANAFVSSRYHRMLYDGDFPPGTPMAYVTAPREFRLLRQGDTEDNTVLTNSGFVAP